MAVQPTSRMYIADNAHRCVGAIVGNGHCVPFVQLVAQAPHTSRWRPGPKARGGNLAPGTVIATFDSKGTYENDTTGRSHAAIFLAETREGLKVLDQWVGRPVGERTIYFRAGEGKPVNDGDQFFTVMA